MNITDNVQLLKKYDILQLMIAQTTINDVNEKIESYVNTWIKNINDVKAVRVHIWVNEMFFNILTESKRENPNIYKSFFKYQLNFEQNTKMKQGEYEFYSIFIATKDKYVRNQKGTK